MASGSSEDAARREAGEEFAALHEFLGGRHEDMISIDSELSLYSLVREDSSPEVETTKAEKEVKKRRRLSENADDDQCVSCLNFYDAPTRDSADFEAALEGENEVGSISRDQPVEASCVAIAKDALLGSSSPGVEKSSLRSWLDDALAAPAVPEKKKRGRKPLPISAEDRAELVRKRNREHARSTRRRQRMYVDFLKSQVDAKASSRARGEKDDDAEQEARSQLCKAVALKFLQFRGSNEAIDRARWRDVVAEACVVVSPCEPYRNRAAGFVNRQHRHEVRGVDAIVADVAAINHFLYGISKRLGVTFRLVYRAEASDVVIRGESLASRFQLQTLGLENARNCPPSTNISVDGMMKATFNRFGRLVDVDLVYDVNALLDGLLSRKLIVLNSHPIPPRKSLSSDDQQKPNDATKKSIDDQKQQRERQTQQQRLKVASIASFHPQQLPTKSFYPPLNQQQAQVFMHFGGGAAYPPQITPYPPQAYAHQPGQIPAPVPWFNMFMPFQMQHIVFPVHRAAPHPSTQPPLTDSHADIGRQ